MSPNSKTIQSSGGVPESSADRASAHAVSKFLSRADLLLPDVPESERQGIRDFLAPFLTSVPIKTGDCWNVAQTLMMAVGDPRVAYVEGVYEALVKGHVELCPCGCGFPAHAWNLVDGHIVDLTLEFRWSTEPTLNRNWAHEPFKEYSWEEMQRYTEDVWELDGYSITPIICDLDRAQEFGYTFTADDRARCEKHCEGEGNDKGWEQILFEPAVERLAAKYMPSIQEREDAWIAANWPAASSAAQPEVREAA